MYVYQVSVYQSVSFARIKYKRAAATHTQAYTNTQMIHILLSQFAAPSPTLLAVGLWIIMCRSSKKRQEVVNYRPAELMWHAAKFTHGRCHRVSWLTALSLSFQKHPKKPQTNEWQTAQIKCSFQGTAAKWMIKTSSCFNATGDCSGDGWINLLP